MPTSFMDTNLQTVILIWMIVLGACIGSFLNVVIYRLPRGESLSHPPSHCPKCNHAIRWYDNVPILGWLWLRGKCRDCQAPISIRYPFVEFVGGLVFGAISYGAMEFNTNSFRPVFEFLFFVLCASSSVLSVLAAGFIAYDGQRIPRRLFFYTVLLAAAAFVMLAWWCLRM